MNNPNQAPLYTALCRLAEAKGVRFHTPGHKGWPQGDLLDDVKRIDYTELPATGNLYDDGGIIQEAEALTARYYGMDGCYFLTCGATQGVKAAISAYCHGGASLVIDRNCHGSVFDACALLDLSPQYVTPAFLPDWGITGPIDPQDLSKALATSGAKAAIITCPTYYGGLMDIAALAEAAHRQGAALIVDGAHGSHLPACGIDVFSPADAVILSAHKTLNALTQGAYLLFRNQDQDFATRLRRATALFGTSSPSYPIMASLDLSRMLLEEQGYDHAVALCRQARQRIEAETAFRVYPSDDPCRLVLATGFGGVSGHEAAAQLRQHGIEPEMSDDRNVVFIITQADQPEDIDRLVVAITAITCKPTPLPTSLPPPLPRKILSPRQAYFGGSRPFTLAESVGQVAAQSIAPYPPGVPVVTFGEEIDEKCVEYLLDKGYNELDIVLCADAF